MKRTILIVALLALAPNFSQAAAPSCDYGGLQVILRNSADQLHPQSNPVKYIDFANDAQFVTALNKMANVGVQYGQVQTAWALSIRQACGERARNITPASVGPTQTLSGLMKLLGLTN